MTLVNPIDCPYYLVSRVTLEVTAALKKELAEAGVERVRPGYLGVLMSLWHEDGLKGNELGRRAGLEPSTMTGLIDRMERDALLERRPAPDDRRAQIISLTAEGKRVKQSVLKVVDRTLSKAFHGISESDFSKTKEVLRRILANAHEENRS